MENSIFSFAPVRQLTSRWFDFYWQINHFGEHAAIAALVDA
jgi:hypothetical protein